MTKYQWTCERKQSGLTAASAAAATIGGEWETWPFVYGERQLTSRLAPLIVPAYFTCVGHFSLFEGPLVFCLYLISLLFFPFTSVPVDVWETHRYRDTTRGDECQWSHEKYMWSFAHWSERMKCNLSAIIDANLLALHQCVEYIFARRSSNKCIHQASLRNA